jgi:hypothetical protein
MKNPEFFWQSLGGKKEKKNLTDSGEQTGSGC